MSAIVGYVGLDGRLTVREEISRMTEALSHRGPDGRATWNEGIAGLGHCMLHTTPESLRERLPLARGNLVITADARIDNREELFSSLQLVRTKPELITDSELILSAYRAWGEDCAQRLLGDFAFAIWDSSKRQLFCARDHFGVKPLYYYHQSRQRFVFASEIKGILCLPDIPEQINDAKIADYILETFENNSDTFYAHVNRLPPGSMMVISEDGVRQSTYWSLGPEREIRMKSDAEYAEAFRSIFFDAVNCRLRSAFPLGTMLSGGLDSSSIACVAHELAGNRAGGNLHTFSVVFNQVKNSDERQFIEKIQASRKFKTHFITGDESTPFDDLERVLWFQDEPFYAPNLFLTRRVWQSASQNGVRVLLDGLFGDNVVSHGIEYLNELAGRGRWFPLARELRQLIEKSGSDMPLWKPLGRYIVQHGIRPRVPESGLSLWRRLRGMPADPVAHQCRVFRTEYSKRTGLRGRLESAYKHGRRIRSARHAHHDALNGGMVQTALEIYNKGCAEFGIETRFPFIDKRLVEYCLAIPGNQKIGQGYTRIILRRALRGVLPEEIRLRTGKGDLGWSFISGFNANREFVGTIIESSNLFLDRFFDVGFLKRIYGRCNSGKAAADDLLTLFLVVVLSVWNARIAAH